MPLGARISHYAMPSVLASTAIIAAALVCRIRTGCARTFFTARLALQSFNTPECITHEGIPPTCPEPLCAYSLP